MMKTKNNMIVSWLMILGLIICSISPINAQYNRHWHFAQGAGLDFSTAPPTATNTAAIATDEGCASISNPNGQLLFYTDGVTIWDATHTAMPNGTGLGGSSSSTQSATIVPYPGTSNLFYVITSDLQCTVSGTQGIRYTLVDMNLVGNGGIGSELGDVVVATSNVLLVANSIATEKVTTACHANGSDYWVITQVRNSGNFQAYHITNTGINTTPVVSAGVATAFGLGAYPPCNEFVGQLKSSPNSSRLAVANRGSGGPNELFDFNNSTGVVSNMRSMGGGVKYGLEFSPNSDFLYLSGSNIRQYDATQTTTAGLQASGVTIFTPPAGTSQNVGAMQLGPDDKIYVSNGYEGSGGNGTTLDVINNPDAAGLASNPQNDGITLAAGTNSRLGLPSFISCAPIPPCEISAKFAFMELGCRIDFMDASTVEPGLNITGWFWEFGDGTTSNQQNPSHIYTMPGIYNVCLTVTSYNGVDCCVDKFCIEVEIQDHCEYPCDLFNPSFTLDTLCGDSCQFVFRGFGPTNVSGWYWDFGDGNTGAGKEVTYTYTTAGSYTVCLTTVGLFGPEGTECCTQTTCMVVNACTTQSPAPRRKSEGNNEATKKISLEAMNESSNVISIFPNPVKNQGTIAFELEEAQQIDLTILTIEGKEMIRLLDGRSSNIGSHQVSFDTSELPEGIYLVSLKKSDGVHTQKLVISKQ